MLTTSPKSIALVTENSAYSIQSAIYKTTRRCSNDHIAVDMLSYSQLYKH